MEISASLYFSCWSLITITSLKLGFQSLELQSSTISQLIIFSLKRILAVRVCHSSTYALVHRHGANNASLFDHLRLSVLGFSFLFYASIFLRPIPLSLVLSYAFAVTIIISLVTATETGLLIDFIVRSVTFSLHVQNDAFFTPFVLVVAFFTSGVSALVHDDFSSGSGPTGSDQTGPGGREIGPVEASKKMKVFKFIASTFVVFAFQLLVRLESLDHVLTFLWLAVAWLGCDALTMSRFESGIFYSLICTVVAGCTVRFGLTGSTCLVNVASVILLALHDILLTVRFLHGRDAVLL
ncbi:hypothetical protein SASPL_119480 [Salvia splendens]|uniref:Uncharacterized protein n=1 Tax=Salvia splendens TaxID=180675 RepID=A0A8X8ZUQ5_SALSN|nr:hypothetical protein SASPL_119480 [Salvia splendens]